MVYRDHNSNDNNVGIECNEALSHIKLYRGSHTDDPPTPILRNYYITYFLIVARVQIITKYSLLCQREKERKSVINKAQSVLKDLRPRFLNPCGCAFLK